MRRRDFIAVLGGAAVVPFAVRAQQHKMPLLGLLSSTSVEQYASRIAAFRQGLKETGYVEGQNLAVDYRWAEGRYDQLPRMAAELVHRQVDAIVAITTPSAIAAKANR